MFDAESSEMWRDLVLDLKRRGCVSIPIRAHTSQAFSGAIRSARAFFSLPLAEKLRNDLPHDCGYHPMGAEFTDRSDQPDPIESFSASARISDQYENLPTPQARELYKALQVAFARLEPISERIIAEMAALVGGRDCASRVKGAAHRWSLLQINHTVPGVSRESYLHPPHEDGNLLTLAFASGPGLEVRAINGQFVDPKEVENEIIVLCGDMAWVLSGGQFIPTFHRVRTPANAGDRYALLYSADLDPERSELWETNDSNRTIDVTARLLANQTRFGLTGFTVEPGASGCG